MYYYRIKYFIQKFHENRLVSKAEIATPKNSLSADIHLSQQIWERKNILLRKIGIKIGEYVAIDSGFEWVLAKNIYIEDHAVIGKNFKCYSYNQVTIGKYCMLAGEVHISNGKHDINSFEPSSGPIEIGNGVWIGHGAKIIGANIRIGENSVIGAGALVIKDVSPNSIVAGVPAIEIGVRSPASKVWHLGNTHFSPLTFDEIKD
jgi:maltose O-acetyltransferase